MPRPTVDITGQKFGRWVAIERDYMTKKLEIYMTSETNTGEEAIVFRWEGSSFATGAAAKAKGVTAETNRQGGQIVGYTIRRGDKTFNLPPITRRENLPEGLDLIQARQEVEMAAMLQSFRNP